MGDNSFGKLLNFTSFGESHGPCIGCIVDGVPPQLVLSEELIQPYLDRRRPGSNKFVDKVIFGTNAGMLHMINGSSGKEEKGNASKENEIDKSKNTSTC